MILQLISFIEQYNINFFNVNPINQLFFNFNFIFNFTLINPTEFALLLNINNNNNLFIEDILSIINNDLYSIHTQNLRSLYHSSIPNTKLFYPEPFTASSSFMHSDLWYIHILIYQYWLWFVFIFIIIFFFITFICTIRWCNPRIRPKRETRGVSRSKCGDLITACVPVSWATSIIVNESTDAIDFYDGFGTTEIVIGIKAYQWGWEYYYPKDIDLNYRLKPNYSYMIGNSLKYENSTDKNLSKFSTWKFFQNKIDDSSVVPAHTLILPSDINKTLNFFNFDDIGLSPLKESNTFKKTRMFSRSYINNLYSTSFSDFNYYKNLNYINFSENDILNSHIYGIKKQHTFLVNQNYYNTSSTFFDSKILNKFIELNSSSNSNFNNIYKNNGKFNQFYNYFNNNINKKNNAKLFFVINDFKNFILYNNILNVINSNTEKKNLNYSILKLWNKNLKSNKNLNNINNLNTINLINEYSFLNDNSLLNNFFNNNFTVKIFNKFSNTNKISNADKSIRKFLNINIYNTNHNFTVNNNSLDYMAKKNINSNLLVNHVELLEWNKSNWLNNVNSLNLLNSRIFFENTYSPIFSSNPFINSFNYDDLFYTNVEDFPRLAQGKDENIKPFVLSAYWYFYFIPTTHDWRLSNNINFIYQSNFSYFPLFYFYANYDFLNKQSLLLLENDFWESSFSAYSLDEYNDSVVKFNDINYTIIPEKMDLKKKFIKNEDYLTFFSIKSDYNLGENYSNFFFTEDFISNLNLTSLNDFIIFNTINQINLIDYSYESVKALNFYLNKNNLIFIFNSLLTFKAQNVNFTFDFYRSDVDEFSLTQYNTLNNFYNLIKTNNFMSEQKINYEFLNNWNKNFFFLNSNRFSDYFKIRQTVKTASINYNALTKVYRTRFDENRAHSNLYVLANFKNTQPLLSSSRINYEKLLGKTKSNFLKINIYKSSLNKNINNVNLLNSLNFAFYDLPFLVSIKSDSSRYLWFDWFTKWSMIEVQPASQSKYSLMGMPHLSKGYEFSNLDGDFHAETELYFDRLAHGRKNYLQNWTYSPYIYAKNFNWYNDRYFDILNIFSNNDLTLINYLYQFLTWVYTSLDYSSINNFIFFNSNSNMSSFNRTNWHPTQSIQSYYYTITNLIDILHKREYLYRQFLEKSNKIVNLPTLLIATPKHPLINELKNAYLFSNPVDYNNEFSREYYLYALNNFNLSLINNYLTNLLHNLDNKNFLFKILTYIIHLPNNKYKNSSDNFYKNQYKPMKKGISNMIRLHATGAIAMPTEMRLQILASSRDVIHSWAVPSAGIKIDCIPGYSSHKVVMFLLSGIYWGQCMEVCGRYHHWMPIVVYFMKRDLFFLWCLHFVLLPKNNTNLDSNDRQNSNNFNQVSFDKLSWLSELNIKN